MHLQKLRWLVGTLAALLLTATGCQTVSVQKMTLAPAVNMTRAEVDYEKPEGEPVAVLVLCPGLEGNGTAMINDPAWREFAQKNHLGLMGLDFASSTTDLQNQRGYYYAAQGSGALLLQAVREAYGKDLPILLFGFSAGAQFASRFAEWQPERVTAWCAYAAGWWDPPQKNTASPPGIVACGDEDAARLGAALTYFKQGRVAGKPWMWMDVKSTGHAPSPALEGFARDYFAAVLRDRSGQGVWVDIDTGRPYVDTKAIEQISESAWLPDNSLLPTWQKLHVP